MYWFSRPPYLRYAAALGLILTAIWLDLRPSNLVDHPYARSDLVAGISLSEADIEWRDVPPGLFAEVPDDGVLQVSVPAGEPLRPSDVMPGHAVAPPDWWSLELDLPPDLAPGQRLQLVVIPAPGLPAPDPIPAVVVNPGTAGGVLDSSRTGLVAVPPDHAATAATARAEGRITVLVRSLG